MSTITAAQVLELQSDPFDNSERRRYYGLRIGDWVEFRRPGNQLIRATVAAYVPGDNNAVIVKNDETQEFTQEVAEWMSITDKIEDVMARVEAYKNPTPGPWKIGRAGTVVAETIPEWYNKKVTTGHSDLEYYGGFLIVESIGNNKDAKLMAAAPELLEVLQTIENDKNQIPPWLWRRIQKAIKAATE